MEIRETRSYFKPVILSVLALIILVVLLSSFYSVEEQNRGIVLSGGAYTETVAPGLHMKIPFYQKVKMLSTQTWTDTYPKLEAYSKDRQTATMRVSVTWAPVSDKLVDLYRDVLDLQNVTDRYITPSVPTQVEITFGKFEAETFSADRDKFALALTNNIRALAPPYIKIASVQVENVDFTPAYEKASEDRAVAEVASKTIVHLEAKRVVEQRIQVAQAKADAESQLAKAKAEAEGIAVRGKAEAEGISAKGAALRDNPMLVELAKADKWNGVLPTTVLPGNATPFISQSLGK